MSETSTGQVSSFFNSLGDYYKQTARYYAGSLAEAPLFMEVLPSIKFTQVVTDSNKLSTNSPSMVVGALNESAYAMFAILREAGMRSKTRVDFWAEAEGEMATNATFYKEHGVLMGSYIRAASPMQV